MSEPECDFCSVEGARWMYDAKSFLTANLVEGLTYGSVEGWFACGVCHRLIESGDQQALSRRSAESFKARYGELVPDPVEVLASQFGELHKQFFERRIGEAKSTSTFM